MKYADDLIDYWGADIESLMRASDILIPSQFHIKIYILQTQYTKHTDKKNTSISTSAVHSPTRQHTNSQQIDQRGRERLT